MVWAELTPFYVPLHRSAILPCLSMIFWFHRGHFASRRPSPFRTASCHVTGRVARRRQAWRAVTAFGHASNRREVGSEIKNAQMQNLLDVPNVITVRRAWCMNELECRNYITALGFAALWLDSLYYPLTCGKQYLNKLQPILKCTRVVHLIITIVSSLITMLSNKKYIPSYWEKDKGRVWNQTIFHLYMLYSMSE